ncbi:tail fiber domain-containing protein [Klebsiella michiganensis]|uniref:tail fiber domain-containing protein n=1 Tax=Klebsiella michiganensis TaxID=1134687 RepID=UPI00374FFBC2
MYHLDNTSGVPEMPEPKEEQSITPRWFGESQEQGGISWPGADWFNTVQAELLNLLQAAGIQPEKKSFNQLSKAIPVLGDSVIRRDLSSHEQELGASIVNSAFNIPVQKYLYPCPDDFLVGTFFDNGKNKTIYLASSPDGITFYRLNTNPLAGINAATTGRDPSILYFNGYWYIAYTGSQNLGNVGDFTVMRSRDMITWKSYPVKAYGNSVIYKKPGAVIGGGISAIKDVWGPSLYVADNQLYAILIVSYNDDTTDIDGNKIGWQVPISLRCNDLDSLTFDLPKLLLHNQDVPRLDTEVIFSAGHYYAVVKNEFNKNIELWISDSPDEGFTQVNSIDFGLHVEGPSLVFNNAKKLWYLYADAYELQGVYYYSTSPDLVTWSSAKKIDAPFQMRHGSVINLSCLPDSVSAIESFKTACALQNAQGILQQLKISGVQYLAENLSTEPVQDKMYAVLGSTDVTLTIPTNYHPHECTVFYVYKASQASTGGITVAGPMINGTFKIGYGDSNQTLFAFVLDPSSKRYNCMGVPSFDTLRNRNNTWTKTNIFNGTVDVAQFLNIGQSNAATGVRRLAFYAQGDGEVSAYVQGSSTGELTLQGNNGVGSAGNLYPTTSAAGFSLGKNTNLWSAVYAQNSAINTSDAREKTSPKDISDDEVSAFFNIGQLPWVWQWLQRYQTEGDNARLHAGPTVQAAIEIMTEHGLNWRNYAAFCYDEWDALDEVWDEWPEEYETIPAQPAIVDNGVIISEEVPERRVLIREAGRILVQKGRPAGNRFSFRKEELLLWVLRATISKMTDIESRLTKLEQR